MTTTRGLWLKTFLRDWKCNLICLQETKLEYVSLSDFCSLRGSSLLFLLSLELQGLQEASNYVQLHSIRSTLPMENFQLLASFKWMRVDSQRLYGPQARVDKLRLWHELHQSTRRWCGPWCMGGDFNVILHPLEKFKCMSLQYYGGVPWLP